MYIMTPVLKSSSLILKDNEISSGTLFQIKLYTNGKRYFTKTVTFYKMLRSKVYNVFRKKQSFPCTIFTLLTQCRTILQEKKLVLLFQ